MPAVFTTGLQTSNAILIEISSWGARLRASSLPRVGDELFLSVDTVRASGTVAWADGDCIGVHFDTPLSLKDLRSLVTEGLDHAPDPA